MFRPTMLLVVVLIECGTSSAFGQARPYMVQIFGKNSVEYRQFLTSVATRYELEDEVYPGYLSTHVSYDVPPPNDKMRTGIARFYSDSGPVAVTKFFVVANGRQAFDAFIRAEVSRREQYGGLKSEVSGGGKHKKVTTGGTTKETLIGDKFHPKLTWHDFYFTHHDHIVAMSESRLDVLDFKALSEMIVPARSRCDYYRFDVAGVPAEVRRAIINNFTRSLGMALQQRTEEDTDDYQLRRKYGEQIGTLVKAAVNELESIEAWVELPRRNRPFKYEASVNFAKDGLISSIIRQLRIPKRIPQTQSNAILKGSFGIERSEYLEAVLHTLGQNFERVRPFAGVMSGQPKLDGQFSLAETQDHHPTFALSFFHERWSAQTLASLVANSPIGQGWDFEVGVPLKFHVDDLEDKQDVIVSTVQPQLHLELVPYTIDRTTLARVDLDLRNWNRDEQNSETDRVMESIEEAVDRVALGTLIGFNNKWIKRKPVKFRSFLDRINQSGSWTANATLSKSASGLRITASVGANLYEWFEARKMAILVDQEVRVR